MSKASCFNCRFEFSCGYSGLATLGRRHEDVKQASCCLGLMSSGVPFFQPKKGCALWTDCDPADVSGFRKIMESRGHAYEFGGYWSLTEEGQIALAHPAAPPASNPHDLSATRFRTSAALSMPVASPSSADGRE